MGNCIGHNLEDVGITLTHEPQHGTYHSHDIYKSNNESDVDFSIKSEISNSI